MNTKLAARELTADYKAKGISATMKKTAKEFNKWKERLFEDDIYQLHLRYIIAFFHARKDAANRECEEVPCDIFCSYPQIITEMLRDANLLYSDNQFLGAQIHGLFEGKLVVEPGCRSGEFLEFAYFHGADVGGSTTGSYFRAAMKNLDGEGSIVESDALNAHKSLFVLEPDFLTSANLFDITRWKGRNEIPLSIIKNSFRAIASPKTMCYINPSTEPLRMDRKPVGSVLKRDDFEKLEEEGIIRDLRVSEQLQGDGRELMRVYRFRFVKEEGSQEARR